MARASTSIAPLPVATLALRVQLAASEVDPRRVALRAFLGDPVARAALGVEPPDERRRWLDCIEGWGGPRALLVLAVVAVERWVAASPARERYLRAARSALGGGLLAGRGLDAAARELSSTPPRPSPDPIELAARAGLRAAAGAGLDEHVLRLVGRGALLDWAHRGATP